LDTAGEDPCPAVQLYLSDAYTVTANLAGIPGISIPVGSTTKGLPVGVQLLGAPFSESTLLSTGKAIMELR
ncbi:MAG: amidase family protein, partial [Bacteroidetes bacterium]|nr:amidase family protein [Bacteroidota bacterium]